MIGFSSSVVLLVYRLVSDEEDELTVHLLQACMAASTLRMLVLNKVVNSLLYSLVATLTILKVHARWISDGSLS